jgi:hypothetical protein
MKTQSCQLVTLLALAAFASGGGVSLAADQLYVSPVGESSGYHIYQVDPDTGASLSVLPAAAGYASGGIIMNGLLYYQSAYNDPSQGSVYDPVSDTISTAWTLPAGNSGFIANGGVGGDAAGNRLFFSFGDTKVWEADVATPGGTASLLYDASALGMQIVGDVAYSATSSSLFVAGYGATSGQILRGTFAAGSWSWSSFLTPSADSIVGLSLDDANGKLYWVTSHSSGPSASSTVQSSNLDGSGMVTILSGITQMSEIAVDANAGRMFLSPRDYGAIQEANLDGSNRHDLATVGGFAATLSIGPAISSVPEPSALGELLTASLLLIAFHRFPSGRPTKRPIQIS